MTNLLWKFVPSPCWWKKSFLNFHCVERWRRDRPRDNFMAKGGDAPSPRWLAAPRIVIRWWWWIVPGPDRRGVSAILKSYFLQSGKYRRCLIGWLILGPEFPSGKFPKTSFYRRRIFWVVDLWCFWASSLIWYERGSGDARVSSRRWLLLETFFFVLCGSDHGDV